MTTRSTGSNALARVPAPALVLGGVVALEGGAALATTVIPLAGIAVTVAFRLGFGAVGLSALRRPRLRGLAMRTVGLVLVVGLLLAAHHLCFYAAIHRLPLGVAVTVEFAGPLTVALVGFRRRADLLWAALAAIGVAVTAGLTTRAPVDGLGLVLALGAGACWAAYILVFPVLAGQVGRADGLALAMLVAAVAVVPYAIVAAGAHAFTVRTVVLGAVIALLADVVAYTLQAEALGRLRANVFSILTSTEPAVGAVLGLIALGQHISAWQWAGMAAVTVASIGASRLAT